MAFVIMSKTLRQQSSSAVSPESLKEEFERAAGIVCISVRCCPETTALLAVRTGNDFSIKLSMHIAHSVPE